MGFLENIGAVPHEYPVDQRSAHWIVTKVTECGEAGAAFWKAIGPIERLGVMDAYYLTRPKKDEGRRHYESVQRLDLVRERDEYVDNYFRGFRQS